MMDVEKTAAENPGSSTNAAEQPQAQSEAYPPNQPTQPTIIYRLHQVRSQSSNSLDFTRKLTAIICGSIFFTILWGLSSIIPIAMITIGAINVRKCSIEPNIPIWLIVSGTFGCLDSLITIGGRLYEYSTRRRERLPALQVLYNFRSLIDFFLIAWLIVGTVWVYNIYGRVNFYKSASIYFCDRTTYLLAFSVITASWILLGLTCLCCICCFPLFLLLDVMSFQ